MKTVLRTKAIEDFRKMFEISETSISRENNGKFMIAKQECERFQVIKKLEEYFGKNKIQDHCVTVDSMTIVFTTFQIVHISTI